MDLIKVGKIVNTHGIKGELKLISNFEYKSKIFINHFKLYINQTEYLIANYRQHQQFDLITLVGFTNINDVLFLKGQEVYINRADLQLNGDVLINDIIGYQVVEGTQIIGQIVDVVNYGAGPLLAVQTKEQLILIPKVDSFIKEINQSTQTINIHHWEGLL